MELISSVNIQNGYTPYINAYTNIYSYLTGYSGFGIGDDSYAISAYSTTGAINHVIIENLSASQIWLHDSSYANGNVISGSSTSVIFGISAVTGDYGVYLVGDHLQPNWAVTADYDNSTYQRILKYFSWSYWIQDAASASVSGCFAYPTDDINGKTKVGDTISAYPASKYFCVSATSWNIDPSNSLNQNESYLIYKIDSGENIFCSATYANGSNYFWVVSLRGIATGSIVDWYLYLTETWSSKNTSTQSGSGTFRIDDENINSASGNTYGGTRGDAPITGARSSLAQSIGNSSNFKWVEFCGVNWI